VALLLMRADARVASPAVLSDAPRGTNMQRPK
jgi:hypothetical protein